MNVPFERYREKDARGKIRVFCSDTDCRSLHVGAHIVNHMRILHRLQAVSVVSFMGVRNRIID